jgi:hypothetical protein
MGKAATMTTTNPAKPVRVLSLGAGVQSTTVLLMMLHGEIEKAEHAVFADTGWEPRAVYEHLKSLLPLMDGAGIHFHQVSNGNLRQDAENLGRFASMPFFIRNEDGTSGITRRQCTNEYKLTPLLNKQRELAGLAKGQRSKVHLLTSVIGISFDEAQRMRDPHRAWMKNDYPLVDLEMTRSDCLRWCKERGYKQPPRSACIGCPFQTDERWRNLRDNQPDEWKDAVAFDRYLRTDSFRQKSGLRGAVYLHKSLVPLDEVDLRTAEEHGQFRLFDLECQGMCGV